MIFLNYEKKERGGKKSQTEQKFELYKQLHENLDAHARCEIYAGLGFIHFFIKNIEKKN